MTVKRHGNDSKQSYLYTSLDNQAKDNKQIIFENIPAGVSSDEITEVIKELRLLSNFKNYLISRNEKHIKGIRILNQQGEFSLDRL